MEAEKRHELTTINQIIDCVNEENIDNFLIDFGNFLKCNIQLKKSFKQHLPENNIDFQKLFKFEKFVWIDDGKNEIKIEIL